MSNTLNGSNSSPGFTLGGNVFGRIAAQWNSYFRAKVDATSGFSTLQDLVSPTIHGGTANFDSLTVNGTGVIGVAGVVAPLSISGGTLSLGYDPSLQVTGSGLGVAGRLAPNQLLVTGTSSVNITSTGTLSSAVQAGITQTGTLVAGASGAGFTLNLHDSTVSGTLGTANGGLGGFRLSGSGTVTVSGTANALTVNGSLVLGGTATVTFSTNGTIGTVGTAPVGQIPGTATNDNAATGKVGEYISSQVLSGAAVALTSGSAVTITSISLTAGDWDVRGVVCFAPAGSTTVAQLAGASNTTTNALPTNTGDGGEFILQATFATGGTEAHPVGVERYSINSTTTIYLIGYSIFSVSTNSAYGKIEARRIR